MHRSRRTFLRSAGAVMALPTLPSSRLWGSAPPKRFAVLFMGNGINSYHWWAKGSGQEMQLGRSLEPLEPVKHKINVINGLFHRAAMGNGIHPAQTAGLLCSGSLEPETTVDQTLARHLGRKSLVLSCEPPIEGRHESGVPLLYSSHLSWRDGAPAVPEAELAGDIRDRARRMCDTIAEAFRQDTARVATLTLARDLSSIRYPFLDVRGDHHTASHDDLSDDYERIVRFHVSQFAYLVRKLDSMPEASGTVLDNCCILFLSNMWSGWKHDNMKLPVLTAGGLGGALPSGRVFDFQYAGDGHRKLSGLYLSILDRFGMNLESFGDADTRLI